MLEKMIKFVKDNITEIKVFAAVIWQVLLPGVFTQPQ
jgi:hypothetical protein